MNHDECPMRIAWDDGLTYKQAAEQFSVGDASVSRWLRLARENGSVAASPMGGSMPILGEAEREILRGLVEQEPDLTLAELGYQLKEVTGLTVSVSTLYTYPVANSAPYR